MKNFLIVLTVLCICFVIACVLMFELDMSGGRGGPGGLSYVVAEWRNYDAPGLVDLQVTIYDDHIIVGVPATPTFKQIIQKGHWNMHAFYCDSHLDAPPEVEVARELKNEDLELDAGYFLPDHPGKITLVKMRRGLKDYHPPYPVNVPGQIVSYPPPKGLIQPGMLECDLQMLPWHADSVDQTPSVVTVHTTTLSDGEKNQDYFPSDSDNNGANDSMVYNYHSDRADAPKLLVTVYHGRVVQVAGGAEETADPIFLIPSLNLLLRRD